MYHRALRHREELMEEANALRRAGKIRAAKGAEGRVQQVEQLLGAIEAERPAASSDSVEATPPTPHG